MSDHPSEIDTEIDRILAMSEEELRADCEARGTTMEAEAAEVSRCFDRAMCQVEGHQISYVVGICLRCGYDALAESIRERLQ